MSPHDTLQPVDPLEARLRREAAELRRPAPERLHGDVMAAIEAGAVPEAFQREVRAVPAAERPRSALRLAAVGALLATAAALLLLLDSSSSELTGGPRSFAQVNELLGLLGGASGASEAVEQPLLQELEALGQDTARAAAGLARGLPGPVGDLFAGK